MFLKLNGSQIYTLPLFGVYSTAPWFNDDDLRNPQKAGAGESRGAQSRLYRLRIWQADRPAHHWIDKSFLTLDVPRR